MVLCIFFFKHKTAYEMRISDWSSDVCSSDLGHAHRGRGGRQAPGRSDHPADLRPAARAADHRPAGAADDPGAGIPEAGVRRARRGDADDEREIASAPWRERVVQYV